MNIATKSKLHELSVEVTSRIRDLVISATHLVQADGAVLVVMEDGEANVALRHGMSAERFSTGMVDLIQLMKTDLFYSDGGNQHLRRIASGSDQECFIASASIQQNGKPFGALVVCDTRRFTLSAAQEYVFRTLAAEIGDQVELQHLRTTQELGRPQRDAVTERLRLLESVVVHANDAVLITEAEPIDLPGPRILYANAAFTRTTGYSLEEVLGQTPRILHGPDTDHAPLVRLKTALREWKPIVVELLNYRKNGTTFWVELSIVPVADETGWYTHWVSVQRDVSQRKEIEANSVRFQLAEAHNVALAHEVEERMRSEQELAHAAYHDNLTGLRNRAYFMDRLKASVERAGNSPEYRCAVMFIDLDGFKEINDRFGHNLGDLLLVEVAKRLKGSSRAQDTVARMGGDEFTVLLDNIDSLSEAVGIVKRTIESLNQPIWLSGRQMILGVSIGLCVGSCHDFEHILRNADTAMYCAKQAGGSQYAVFSQEMHESAMAALDARSELRISLEEQQLEVHYQPLVDTKLLQICGVEALVRWRHPERGLVRPLDFIGIAEETGLIVPLGSWVLHEACRHLSLWRRTIPADQPFKVSVNVSPRQLEDETFFSNLESALYSTSIRPGDLQLEVTESVFLNNPERIGALLMRIRQLGVRIACDDFGTGYSSLSYLQLYPIDMIKVDQSFVSKLDMGQTDIVRMIVGLAHSLRMSVSAEGVANLRQQEALRELGCSEVQGYLYSEPICFEAMTELLEHGRAFYPEVKLPLIDRAAESLDAG